MKRKHKTERPIKSYISDKIYINNDGYSYKIIDEFYDREKHKRSLKVKFINSGYEKWVSESCIIRNQVKDPYSRTLFNGLACTGEITDEIRTHPLFNKLYITWYHMLLRCYNENSNNFETYGKSGIRVDKYWMIFVNFFYDALEIPGIDRLLNGEKSMALDKDFRQYNLQQNQKIYSKDTCVFLPNELNSALPAITQGKYNHPIELMNRKDYDYYKQYLPDYGNLNMCNIVNKPKKLIEMCKIVER